MAHARAGRGDPRRVSPTPGRRSALRLPLSLLVAAPMLCRAPRAFPCAQGTASTQDTIIAEQAQEAELRTRAPHGFSTGDTCRKNCQMLYQKHRVKGSLVKSYRSEGAIFDEYKYKPMKERDNLVIDYWKQEDEG